MAATGRAAVRVGFGEPFEIREFPVPEVQPGSILIKMSLANICGSDLHAWRGDTRNLNAKPRHQGHEGTGRIVQLGEGVTVDSDGKPLAAGDRVIWGLFYPCGRCHACVYGKDWCCPNAFNHVGTTSVETWPHFRGTFGDYHYLFPNHTVFKVPEDIPDELVAGLNCAMAQVTNGWDVAHVGLGEQVVIQGAGGLGVYAIAVARERGAARIIVIDGVQERLDL